MRAMVVWILVICLMLAGCSSENDIPRDLVAREGEVSELSVPDGGPAIPITASASGGEEGAAPSQVLPEEPPMPSHIGIVRTEYEYRGATEAVAKSLSLDATERPVRVVEYVGVDATKEALIYSVHYPAEGMTSRARLDVRGVMLEETFAKKWRIKYAYDDSILKLSGVPTSYTVCAWSAATKGYDKEINSYRLVGFASGQAMYRDTHGRELQRDPSYFRGLLPTP